MKPKDHSRDLSHQRLISILDYDADTGIFYWKSLPHKSASNIRIGDVAGYGGNGYVRICLSGQHYLAHRLAWFYVHGKWPEHRIDHINRKRSDNRIANLREATDSQNSANGGARKTNKLGIRGVRLHECGKYTARIQVRGKPRYLGVFETCEAAVEAYNAAARSGFGEFARQAK